MKCWGKVLALWKKTLNFFSRGERFRIDTQSDQIPSNVQISYTFIPQLIFKDSLQSSWLYYERKNKISKLHENSHSRSAFWPTPPLTQRDKSNPCYWLVVSYQALQRDMKPLRPLVTNLLPHIKVNILIRRPQQSTTNIKLRFQHHRPESAVRL